MRFLTTLITLCAMGYGVYLLDQKYPSLKNEAIDRINIRTFQSIESRFTESQIIEKEHLKCRKESTYPSQASPLSFWPHLLMEVKYTTPKFETEEGIILWDLMDGEMVLEIKSWNKTHGFADCINAGADKYEYQILQTIARNGGKADRDALRNSLKIEVSIFEASLERARRKKLIVKQGDLYRIHLCRPLIAVPPTTKIDSPFVIKNCKHNERVHWKYSPNQIKRASEAAFGPDFAIRSAQVIFLPIYELTIQSSDGSFMTTYWNAFNGKRVSHLSEAH